MNLNHKMFCMALIVLSKVLCLPLYAVSTYEKASIHRIALIGCHRQNRPCPAFNSYVGVKPDLCLWMGDNVYADTLDDPGFIQACYDKLAARPAFKKLRDDSIFMATWDDHDFGYNNFGKYYPLKAESKDIFRRFWSLEKYLPAERQGVYYARTFEIEYKLLQVIMLDVRYNRDDPGEYGDVLGPKQWAWLERQLKTPADLRLFVSGFQLLLDRDSGSETWSKFPQSRNRLFQLIRNSRIEGVLFITGDQHYAEVCRMPFGLDFDIIELQFCGVNQIEEPAFNSFRVSPVCESLNTYAYLDIQWTKDKYDIPHLTYKVFDADTDKMELSYRANFNELELNLHFVGNEELLDKQEVALLHNYANLNVRYTLDGSEPTKHSPLYTKPFNLMDSTVIRACFFDGKDMPRSKCITKSFIKTAPEKSVELSGTVPGLSFSYYEGDYKALPDFAHLQSVKTGIATDFNVATLSERDDHYAISFRGYVHLPRTAIYEFITESDDGSQLFIGNNLVVDNDGSHSPRRRTGRIALEKGAHPITINYFEDYMGQTLSVGYSIDGAPEIALSFDQLTH